VGTIVSDNPLVTVIRCLIEAELRDSGKIINARAFSEKNFIVLLRNLYIEDNLL